MVKLSNAGAFLINGTEVVECNGEEQAALTAKPEGLFLKRKLQRTQWHIRF